MSIPRQHLDDLRDKVAVITGGAGVIGGALSQGLAAVGMNIAILDLDGDKAEARAAELSQEYGTRCVGIVCDVLSKDSIAKAHEALLKEFSTFHCLINGAGGNSRDASSAIEQIDGQSKDLEGSFFDIPDDAFRKTLDLNLLGTVFPTQILAQSLVKQGEGAILNISSMNAYRPLTKIPAYSAGKGAVSNFTEWLATHLAQTGVRVNAIAPGYFLTEQLKYLAFDDQGEMTERYRNVLKLTPMHRFGEPEELIGPTLFLLSRMSQFITGVIIPVDGGFNAYSGV